MKEGLKNSNSITLYFIDETDLKNQIENDLKIKLIFQSYQKILRLIID